LAAGVPVRHVEAGTNVPMYRTSAPRTPAGASSGPPVVSMRPIPARLVPLAVTTTPASRRSTAPVHVGDPGAIGIADLDGPDYGERDTRLGVGGTFTDLVALSEGALLIARVPSTPRGHSEGVMKAIEAAKADAAAVDALAHGTTVAANSPLERRGRGRPSSRPRDSGTCSRSPARTASPPTTWRRTAPAGHARPSRFTVK
jgi:hypothetical protein